MARSWSHNEHSGVQTPRPSLCNLYNKNTAEHHFLCYKPQIWHLCLVRLPATENNKRYTGAAFADTKGLVAQVDSLMGEIPPALCMVKIPK